VGNYCYVAVVLGGTRRFGAHKGRRAAKVKRKQIYIAPLLKCLTLKALRYG